MLDMSDDRYKIIMGSLQISSVEAHDKGKYKCIAENVAGKRESQPPAIIQVLSRPNFIKKPSDVSTFVDETVEFGCQAVGDPKPSITWSKQDGKIALGR